MKIEIFYNAHSLPKLQKMWNQLLACSGFNSVFLTYEWFTCFIKSFRLEDKLAIIVIRNIDEIVGILPLYKHRLTKGGYTCTILKSISNVHTPKYNFIIKAGYEDMLKKALIISKDYIHWDLIQLDYVSKKSYIMNKFCPNAPDQLSIRTVPTLKSPHIIINSDWSEYYNSISRNLRTNINRRERKSERDYGIHFERISGNLLNSQILNEAFRIEDKSWKGANGSSILSNEQVTNFYHDLAFAMNEKGWFDLLFLKFADKRVAFDYCLKFNSSYNMLKIGYDDEYKKYTPGMILRKLAIMNTFNNRYGQYDFLGAADEYKLKMANGLDELYSLYIFNNKFKSKILKYILFDAKEIADRMGFKNRLKKIYYKLRKPIERRG